MTLQIRDPGAVIRECPLIRVKDVGGVLRSIREGKILEGGALKLFYPGMTGYVYPDTWFHNQGVFNFPYTLYSNIQAQIIVTGALAPVAYSWTRVAGSANIYAESPLSQMTRFVSHFNADATRTTIFTGAAIDAAGRVIDGQCEITLETLDWD